MAEKTDPRAFPLATKNIEKHVFKLVREAKENEQLRIGANQAAKALKRGLAELVIIAANAEPLEITLHLPLLCVDKNVRYVFVRSKTALGRACNIRRKVIACAIVKKIRSPLVQQINTLQSEIEKFCGSRI